MSGVGRGGLRPGPLWCHRTPSIKSVGSGRAPHLGLYGRRRRFPYRQLSMPLFTLLRHLDRSTPSTNQPTPTNPTLTQADRQPSLMPLLLRGLVGLPLAAARSVRRPPWLPVVGYSTSGPAPPSTTTRLRRPRPQRHFSTTAANDNDPQPPQRRPSRFLGVQMNKGRWVALLRSGGKRVLYQSFPADQEKVCEFDHGTIQWPPHCHRRRPRSNLDSISVPSNPNQSTP